MENDILRPLTWLYRWKLYRHRNVRFAQVRGYLLSRSTRLVHTGDRLLKITLLAAVKTSLMGCCGSIPDDPLVGLAKGMSDSVASIVVSLHMMMAQTYL